MIVNARVPLALTALVVLALPSAARSDPQKVGYPSSIAAIGDSITKAYNTERRPFTDGPAYSWSTGTRGAVQSAYLRILAANPLVRERRANVAKDGARMRDLVTQVGTAIPVRPDYLTIMLGANDVCRPSEAAMTPVTLFRSQLEAGMRMLSARLPDARIQVVSIPDVHRLWSLFRGSLVARTVWRLGGICASLLQRPGSTAKADETRRAGVRGRTMALNRQLSEVCAQYIHCRYDSGAVYGTQFAKGDVSSRDYFHPSRTGQAKLAAIVWGATFDFRDTTAPVSVPLVAPAVGGVSVSFTAADDKGVAGVEYRLGGGAWSRYTTPVLVASGQTIEHRAVDVNGNIEASRLLIA